MTKERFSEMFLALFAGNTIEVQTRHGMGWVQVRLAKSGEHFEVASRQGWRPAPLGGCGHDEWRYPSEQKFLG